MSEMVRGWVSRMALPGQGQQQDKQHGGERQPGACRGWGIRRPDRPVTIGSLCYDSRMKCLSWMLMVVFTLVVPVSPASAQRDEPVTASSVLESVARVYHTRPVSEIAVIRVTTPRQRKTEQIQVRTRPERKMRDWREATVNVELDLGDVVVWTEGKALRAVHRLDVSRYFEAIAEERAFLDSINEVLPPLPLPQLDFVFGDRTTFGRMTSYAPTMEWSARVETVSAQTIRLHGRSGTASVELEVHPKSHRLQYLIVDVERGQAVIEVVFRKPDDGARRGRALGESIEGREKLAALTDLRARPGDIEVGRRLPDLLVTLHNAESADAAAKARAVMLGPGALVLFPAWDAQIDDAFEAIDALVDDGDLERAWPIVLYDVAAGGFGETLDSVAASVSPHPVHFTLSERSTIRRFSADATAAIVIIDGANVVRDIIELGGSHDAGELRVADLRARIADSLKEETP